MEILTYLAEGTGLEKEEVADVFKDLEVGLETESPTIWTILKRLLLMLFTDNLILSAAQTNLLPLIVFSIIFAGMLTTMGEKVRAITVMIGQVNDALMSFILLLMKVAPLGIFCLVAARFGKAKAEGKFLEVLSQTGWYSSTVLAGLALHAFVTLPVIYWIFTKKNPYRFMYHMSQALLTAFSTASSSATLPVTMECANIKAGVSKRSTEFVLPLGATINMDGTALYEAVAAIFIAQAIGFPLDPMQQLIIAITATLAAIGAAGIPEAGLVTMVIVLNAIGLPIEYMSLILAVDWLLDRFRTAVNAFGDSVGAAVVERAFPR
jgi:Na+/H+-dicarboxylate symporter